MVAVGVALIMKHTQIVLLDVRVVCILYRTVKYVKISMYVVNAIKDMCQMSYLINVEYIIQHVKNVIIVIVGIVKCIHLLMKLKAVEIVFIKYQIVINVRIKQYVINVTVVIIYKTIHALKKYTVYQSKFTGNLGV